jgi:PAS domain S-box-containing protein
MQHQTATEARSVGWTQNGEQQWLNIHVKPVTKEGDPAKGFLLVIFEPHTQEQSPEKVVLTADEPIALQLEEELIGVKAQLRLRAEQYEYQAEELKASNEELQAMNEELRTVNQELKVKIEEISLTSDNLQNLINSADVATIFLDRGFCTRLYTPATRQIFNLNPSDYGRPISDITHRLEYSHLLQDAQTVLEKLSVLEREVTTRDQQTFMMRILPYRTTDDRINGVVITFFDITKRKQTENALLHSEERLRLLIESARDYAIYMLDTERRVISWSSGAQGIFGYTEAEIIGKSGDIVFLPEDRNQQVPEWEAETAEKEGRAENERWHLRKDGSRFWGSGLTQPLTDEEGNTIGFVKILRNLTDTKRLEEAKFFLAAIVETSNDSIITIDFQRNITSWNKAAQHLYGYTAQEAIGKNLTLLTLPEDLSGILNNVDAIEHSREVLIFDTVRHTKEGQRIHLEIVMSPVLNPLGEVIGISTIARNVSERKRREANLAFLAKINLDFAPLLTVQDVMEPIGEQLAAYLQLSGCHFSMVDEEHDRLEVIYQYRQDETLAGIRGVHRLSDTFTQEGSRCLGAGKLAVTSTAVDNLLVKTPTHTLKQLSFGLRVDVPHLEGGRWRFLLTVGRAEMGEWRSDELELLQELAAKIYIRLERAKAEEALRKSQQQLQQLNESLEKQVSEHTQALRNSRDMLQSVFDTTLLSLSILKAVRDERGTITDFQILLVNKELERETGRNDLVGKLYVAEYPGIRQVGVFDLMAQVMETGEQGQLEFYYPHENFNKWYSAMFVKLEDGLVASSLDITERKLAEAELTRNFTILKQAEEVAGMGSWEYNMASNSFSWSEGMYRLFGLPVGTSIRPEIYLDYVIAQDRPIAEKIIHTLSSGQEPLEETLRISVNGQVVTLKIKASVLTDETGKPVKMLGVDIDMSKVKQLEQENLKMRLEQQQQLLHAILEAQEEERRRISESLHNGVGQILYATKLNLERMDYEEQPGGEKEWQEALNTASELLSEAIVETRRVSHELVPVLLKEFGLEEAVADFCQRFTGQGLQLHYQVRGIEGRLESHMELALYRLSQELINNIIKHAGATQASLLLEKREGEIRLEVSDNGKGFDPEQVRQKGIGLKTMQDRVELLGGKLILASQDGQGTQISILIPL